MTTQNTEPENSDVNETVVEQPSASETPATTAETDMATPADEQVTQTQAIEAQAFEKAVEEEAIRPFTDFIEEFRQAEVRFGSLLEEPETQPFSSLMASEEQGESQFNTSWANTPFGESTLLEGTPFAVEGVDTYASTQFGVPVETDGNVVEELSEPRIMPEGEQLTTQEQEHPAVEAEGEAEIAAPTERPVSPLLRPSSRMRLPRHESLRHREDPAEEAKVQEEDTTEAAATASLSTEDIDQAQMPPVESTTVETNPEEEQPRPARRYRFDRRAPASAVPAAQARTEEKGQHVPSPTLSHTDNGQVGEGEEQAAQQPIQPANVAQATEQSTPKQAVAQETVATQDAEIAKEAQGASSKAVQDRRRRHGQERQRGKAKAAPATSIPSTPVPEVAELTSEAQAPEVALEDLPPLEYSELQAASSRRRRRRRSSSASSTAAALNNNTPAASTPATGDSPAPEVQTPSTLSPISPVTAPRSVAVPGSPVPSANQYSIVSGYTVNQMNQGNEVSGPFMGPEPAAARGSTMSRTVRPIRNEAQRIPAYPTRSNEVVPSSTSINQLTNAVVQAIQTQTDRMVSELRRANQIPTNVSVSLPQLPSTERVGVFVDVANLLYSARTQRLTVDFGKLLDFLRGNRRLVRAHAYCPTSPQPGDDQMFLQAVKGLGYRITTKNYKTFSSGAKKADLDLDLCMDVVRLVEGKAVDCIVLVSGDSDFMPMLDYCSDHGVRVEVAAFDESMSATLRQSCDLFINLSMLDEIRA